MALNQAFKKTERFLIPEDSYIAKLYSVVDLGQQITNFRLKDKETGEDLGPQVSDQVFLSFELQGVDIEGKGPAVISQTFTASLASKSNLGKKGGVLHSLLGGTSEALDFIQTEGRTVADAAEKALGRAVMLQIIHKDSKGETYSNIGNISPLPSKDKNQVTPLVNSVVLILDADEASKEDLERIPEYIRKKLMSRNNRPATQGKSPF